MDRNRGAGWTESGAAEEPPAELFALRFRSAVCRTSPSPPAALDRTTKMEIDHGELDRCPLRNSGFGLEVLVLDFHMAQNHRAEVRDRDHGPKGVAGIGASRTIDQ